MTVQIIESTSESVCSWDSDVCCDPLAGALAGNDEVTKALAQRSVNAAAEIMYALSGRQFGECELTVRPCRTDCCDPCEMSGYRWTPALIGGQWTNVSCGTCGDTCSCTKVCEVALPGPITSIIEVRLNGVVLPPTSYRVDNRRTLVALTRPVDDGNGGLVEESYCWPTCQDMNLDATKDNTWQVTYLRGKPVPDGGKAAFSELACELYKACTSDGTCKLPKRVTSITRDGVTMAFLDPQTFMAEGLTGLYMPDLWIKSVNPKALPRSAAILSPDMVAVRRTTWQAP